MRLGTLVTGVTYRNVAHLAKIVATLDVLSGGRAVCGLGAAWFEREHKAYGWPFPPLAERYALLEDALQLLPLMWGPGSPSFDGTRLHVPEAICYPRPLQEHVPILVGGSGERRTLRLVAQYADACNLFGDADDRRATRSTCCTRTARAVGRDPPTVARHPAVDRARRSRPAELSTRWSSGCGRSGRRPRRTPAAVNAGTVEEHVGRFRELADAGVQTAIVSLPDLGDTAPSSASPT